MFMHEQNITLSLKINIRRLIPLLIKIKIIYWVFCYIKVPSVKGGGCPALLSLNERILSNVLILRRGIFPVYQ